MGSSEDARLVGALYHQNRPTLMVSPNSTIAANLDALVPPRTLAVFDVDGTLLVSKGREILTYGQDRVALHPLIEVACRGALPAGCSSEFAYSGEEDLNGDEFQLLRSAHVILPVAEQLRAMHERDDCDVAILTARGHAPEWLAAALTAKLKLRTPLRPELVMTVYSAGFEAEMTASAGSLGRTEQRKAWALGQMIERTEPTSVHFFDDMLPNREAALRYMKAQQAEISFEAHDVPLEACVAACVADGACVKELIHPQCRDERARPPNALVRALLASPAAHELGLHTYELGSAKAAAGPLPP